MSLADEEAAVLGRAGEEGEPVAPEPLVDGDGLRSGRAECLLDLADGDLHALAALECRNGEGAHPLEDHLAGQRGAVGLVQPHMSAETVVPRPVEAAQGRPWSSPSRRSTSSTAL